MNPTSNSSKDACKFIAAILLCACTCQVVSAVSRLEDMDQSSADKTGINIGELDRFFRRIHSFEQEVLGRGNYIGEFNKNWASYPKHRRLPNGHYNFKGTSASNPKPAVVIPEVTRPDELMRLFGKRGKEKRNNILQNLLNAAHSLGRMTTESGRSNTRFHAWGG